MSNTNIKIKTKQALEIYTKSKFFVQAKQTFSIPKNFWFSKLKIDYQEINLVL